jgi:flagellar motor switch protein FliN
MSSEHASNTSRASAPLATAQVISLGELHGDAAHRAAPAAAPVVDSVNPLHAVRARLQVCVGEVELSVGELMAAKEYQVLVLDRAVDQPVDMLLEGKVVARGQLVAVDGCFAVRITELPAPLKT